MDNNTDNEKIQASEIISKHCCGVGLPVGTKVCDLANKVIKLEKENKQLHQTIDVMINEN